MACAETTAELLGYVKILRFSTSRHLQEISERREKPRYPFPPPPERPIGPGTDARRRPQHSVLPPPRALWASSPALSLFRLFDHYYFLSKNRPSRSRPSLSPPCSLSGSEPRPPEQPLAAPSSRSSPLPLDPYRGLQLVRLLQKVEPPRCCWPELVPYDSRPVFCRGATRLVSLIPCC